MIRRERREPGGVFLSYLLNSLNSYAITFIDPALPAPIHPHPQTPQPRIQIQTPPLPLPQIQTLVPHLHPLLIPEIQDDEAEGLNGQDATPGHHHQIVLLSEEADHNGLPFGWLHRIVPRTNGLL